MNNPCKSIFFRVEFLGRVVLEVFSVEVTCSGVAIFSVEGVMMDMFPVEGAVLEITRSRDTCIRFYPYHSASSLPCLSFGPVDSKRDDKS